MDYWSESRPSEAEWMYKQIPVPVAGGEVDTAYFDEGNGPAVLLLHGSGPGVSAEANWVRTLPALSGQFRVVAPDLMGFGQSPRPDGAAYEGTTWIEQAVGLLDALGISQCSVIGNSFGGALSLGMSLLHPHRVTRQVLMGPGGVAFTATPALERAWGYAGTTEAEMHELLVSFVYDASLVTDDIVTARHAAAMRPGILDEYAKMFPPPAQQRIDSGALSVEQLQSITQDTLVIHGRDDRIVPLTVGVDLVRSIPNAQLHVFGKCGHWVQFEQADRFNRLVIDFLQN